MNSVRSNLNSYLFVGLFLVNVFIWQAVFAGERNGILTVAFLDVGQGDAIFIEAPNGNQVLIDGGANKSVLRQLSNVMPFYDRSIDIVLATHPDKDHIGGLVSVLERYKGEKILEPGVKSNTGVYQSLQNIILEREVSRILARRGMTIVLDDGIFLNILFPDRDVSGIESNDASIIAQLVYGETEFLFTGDAPQKIERYLASIYGKALQSDVLKVSHHGSKTSSSKQFIGFVSPDYAVISAGRDNRYGHPHKEVLETFEQFEIKILSTYEEGTILFESDGESIFVR